MMLWPTSLVDQVNNGPTQSSWSARFDPFQRIDFYQPRPF